MAFLLCADATSRFDRNTWSGGRRLREAPSNWLGWAGLYQARKRQLASASFLGDIVILLLFATTIAARVLECKLGLAGGLDARNCHVSMPFRSCLRKARLQGSQSVSRWTPSGPLCCGIDEVRRCCHIDCLTLASLSTSISCLPVVGFGLTGSLQLHQIKLLRLLPKHCAISFGLSHLAFSQPVCIGTSPPRFAQV